MSPKALANELNRTPFVPLRIRLTDGREVDIRNPGLCYIAHLALYVFNARPRDVLAEDVQLISLRSIVSIEPLDSERAD